MSKGRIEAYLEQYKGRSSSGVHFGAHAIRWLLAVLADNGITEYGPQQPPSDAFQVDYPIGFRRYNHWSVWEASLFTIYAWCMANKGEAITQAEREWVFDMAARRWGDPWWEPTTLDREQIHTLHARLCELKRLHIETTIRDYATAAGWIDSEAATGYGDTVNAQRRDPIPQAGPGSY